MNLEWGQTPWDSLSREELLREVQRMYSALVSAKCVMRLSELHNPESPFWIGRDGSGGRALMKCHMILGPLHKDNGGEQIFRMFGRYADDLLFTREIGYGWSVCSECGAMLGRGADPDEAPMDGKRCAEVYPLSKDCGGAFRALEWADLEPKAKES